ncbi:uncharacterized protein LOC123380632 isoform X2 [Felis catus]|uniref:uncharacterized protein LOC123380632 isoform X2 n=1 Tax=Felis catus TaxID=9685 RepID=UPI001D1A2113|nr:uncharacterized protein LOC123380632 isoform X2 [Felis catus]
MGSLLASVPHHTTQTGTGLPPGPLAEDGLVKGLSRRSAFCLPPCDPDRSLPTSSECENKPEVARASWKEDYKKPRQCHDFPLRHSVGPHPRFSPPGSRRASFSLFWASGGCLRSRLGSAQSSPEREQRDPSPAFRGVRALHASAPLHTRPFLTPITWELLSLPGLSSEYRSLREASRSLPTRKQAWPVPLRSFPEYPGSLPRWELLEGRAAPSACVPGTPGPDVQQPVKKSQTRPWPAPSFL